MRTASRSLAAALALLILSAAPLQAQRPQVREGFWIGFGFGYGSLGASCDGCADIDREGGATFHLRMGGTLAPNLLLGGELNGWATDNSSFGTEIVAANASAAVYFYPMATGGLFLKGGLGFATYSEQNGGELTSDGVGLLLGGGYDIRVSRNFSLTPVVSFYLGTGGDLEFDGTTVAEGWNQNVIEFALGFTFH